MRSELLSALILLGCVGPSFGQPQAVEFEVAAVRQLGTSGPPCCMGGGPGTPQPTRIRYQRVTLAQVIMKAYDIRAFQLVGPSWLTEEKYEILASVPPGTTPQEVPLMLQNLLEERWKLRIHRASKDLPGYVLRVAKGGATLPPTATTTPERGSSASYRQLSGGVSLEFQNSAMSNIVHALETWMDRAEANPLFTEFQIKDETGLDGRYDFTLVFATGTLAQQATSALPDVRTALEDIGLRLEKSTFPYETIVVDSVSRSPTDN